MDWCNTITKWPFFHWVTKRGQNVCFLISCLVLPENKKLDIQHIGTFYFLATVTPAVNELLPLSQKFFFFFSVSFFSPLESSIWQFSIWNKTCHDFFETLCHLISACSSHDPPAFLCWYKPDIVFRKYLLCPRMLHLVIWLCVHVKCPVRVCILFFSVDFFFSEDLKYHFCFSLKFLPILSMFCFVQRARFHEAHFQFA